MIFIYQNKVLKIGIAGANSHARFQSQHYYPESSQSNLAKSLINDVNFKHDYDNQNIGDWIKQNCHRINIFISTRQKREILNQLKGFYSKLG